MLESLDKVPWANFNSKETPDLIRRLVSDDDAGQSEALSELFDNLAHQGTVYEASLAATPFLIETIRSVTATNRETLLSMIATIGSSTDCVGVEHEALKQAVASGIDTYLELLNSPVARDREAATVLLSLCTERAQEVTAILRFRMKMETDEAAKAGLLLALGLLDRQDSLELLTNAFRAHEGLVRLAVALVSYRVAAESLPLDIRGYLFRAQAGVFPAEDIWEKSFWSFHSELIPGPGDVLENAEPEERAEGRAAMLEALPHSNASTAVEILETLIWMDFGFSKEPVSATSLMAEEIETLEALSRCPHAWPPSEALQSALRQHGLPLSAHDIRTLLGNR